MREADEFDELPGDIESGTLGSLIFERTEDEKGKNEIPFISIHDKPVEFKSRKRKIFIPNTPVRVRILGFERSVTTHLLHPYLYTIQVEHGNFSWIIQRRYKSIHFLHQQLKLFRATLMIPFPTERHRNDRENLKELKKSSEETQEKSSSSLPRFPSRPEVLVGFEDIDNRVGQLEDYLNKVLSIKLYRDHPETVEFLSVSHYSFVKDLGMKGMEEFVEKQTGSMQRTCDYFGICEKLNCCGPVIDFFTLNCNRWKKRWLFVKDTFLGYVRARDGLLRGVILFDHEFEVSSVLSNIRRRDKLQILNLQRRLVIKCDGSRKKQDLADYIKETAKKQGYGFTYENSFSSFAPRRSNCVASWYVDGSSYMFAVADAINNAKEEIFITDWWLSPEIYLKRPVVRGKHEWRLDWLLRKKANEGVKIFVLLYKEVRQALGLDSNYSRDTLRKLHPENIKVLRHPDHAKSGVFLWAHHEKIVCIDQTIAFLGGIDLCYGRWDTHEHRLSDFGGVHSSFTSVPECDLIAGIKRSIADGSGESIAEVDPVDLTTKFINNEARQDNPELLQAFGSAEKIKNRDLLQDEQRSLSGSDRSGDLLQDEQRSRSGSDRSGDFVQEEQKSQPEIKKKGVSVVDDRKSLSGNINKQVSIQQNRKSVPGILKKGESVQDDRKSMPRFIKVDESIRDDRISVPRIIRMGESRQDDRKSMPAYIKKEESVQHDRKSLPRFIKVDESIRDNRISVPRIIRMGESRQDDRKSMPAYIKKEESVQHDRKSVLRKSRTGESVQDDRKSLPGILKKRETVQDDRISLPKLLNREDSFEYEQNKNYQDGIDVKERSSTPELEKKSFLKKITECFSGHCYTAFSDEVPAEKTVEMLSELEKNSELERNDARDELLAPPVVYWIGKDYTNFILKDFCDLDAPFQDMFDRKKTPRMPWHDIGVMVHGSAARDVARHFIQRWNAVKIEKVKKLNFYPYLLPKSYERFDPPPKYLTDPQFDVKCQVLRSISAWSGGFLNPEYCEESIHRAYLESILKSEHYIYIENQFFVSPAKQNDYVRNRVGEEIVSRIVRAHTENKRFRVYVVIPLLPGFEGEIGRRSGNALHAVTHWNYSSICKGSFSIVERLKELGVEDPFEYITFHGLRKYSKFREDYVTELIYVHSKLMIVDDLWMICGSANINDRSLLGIRDSEIAILIRDKELIKGRLDDSEAFVGKFTSSLRKYLFAEHLGLLGPNYSPTDELEDIIDGIDLSDPVSDSFYEKWLSISNNNTKLFEEVFRCYPSDRVTTFEEFDSYCKEKRLIDMDREKAKKLLEEIRGHLVDFPLEFLKNEDLTPKLTDGVTGFMPMTLWT